MRLVNDRHKYITNKESEKEKGLLILQSISRILECKSTESINQSIMQNDGGKQRVEGRLIERSMV